MHIKKIKNKLKHGIINEYFSSLNFLLKLMRSLKVLREFKLVSNDFKTVLNGLEVFLKLTRSSFSLERQFFS